MLDKKLTSKEIKPKSKSNSHNKLPNGKAWWNSKLTSLAKEVRSQLRQWELNKADSDLKLAYLQKQREFSKKVRSSKRSLTRRRQFELIETQRKNHQAFWKFIKSLGNRSSSDLPESIEGNSWEVIDDPSLVKEERRNYFEHLLNPSTSNCPQADQNPVTHSTTIPEPDFLNDEITLEEVQAAVKANNSNKSPGIDGIQPVFLKNEGCIEFLHSLFNYCFKTRIVPDVWLKSVIKPIPKASTKSIRPSEYRGISLQSLVAKSYCRILNNRLRDYLELDSIISEEQNGFRPDRSCQDHIFTLASLIENRFADKKDTFTCFIDLKKAFDCQQRPSLE